MSETGTYRPKSSGPRRRTVLAGLAAVLATCCGCPITGPTKVPGKAWRLIEPKTQRPYLLYVPTTHTVEKKWPLVITCHGSWPWDRYDRQIKEWQWYAEQYRFIVAAPKLKGTNSLAKPPLRRQLAYQRADEEMLLNLVKELSAKFNADPSRVMLTGWSAGAYAVLYTGLRNPDVFRALAVRMGNFDRRYVDLPSVTERMDRHQKLFLFYGRRDVLRKEALAAVDWLHRHDWDDNSLRVVEFDRTHESLPAVALQFFMKVLRSPHVIIEVDPVARSTPMRVRFSCGSWPKAVEYLWRFGDGSESDQASPIHEYAKPGRYRFRVVLRTEGGKILERTRTIHVPLGPR